MASIEKKVVLLLVEGDTDEILLIERLRDLFKDREIRFEPQNGDLFYDLKNHNKSIKEIIGEKVKEILIKRKFKPSNILAVLHILDTDGCFINSENIKINPKQSELTKYNSDSIDVINETQKYNIEMRNEVRSRNINIMNSTNKILSKKYNYQVYYFSRNLEHVVFGDMNPIQDTKVEKIEDFLDKLKVPIEKFLEDYMPVNKSDSYEETYIKSWEFLKEGVNSLKRYTNTPLIFNFLNKQIE